MLIKAKKGDRILFCGYISPSEAIKKYADCDLTYLVNSLADPTLKTETGAISVRDSNFGSAEWLFLEFDKELPEFKCQPSKVIESSPGHYHVYWRVPELESLGLEEVKQYFRALCNHYGTDLTKPLQMMRLPGSLNHKYDPPAKVKLVYENPSVHSLEDLFDGIPVEESPKRIREKKNEILEALLTVIADKLNKHCPFPATCHNNHLNATAFVYVQDWANLVGRDNLIDLLKDWATENSHLPASEIESTLNKFLDERRYPSRYLFEGNQEPDLSYKKSIAYVYSQLFKRVATYTGDDGKEKVNGLMAASVKDWFLRRLLSNVGYSPRCNYYLDLEGNQVSPYRILSSLEGWIIGSLKEERRIYGLLEDNVIEPICEYFKSLPKVSKAVAESTLKELFVKVMGLSEIDYLQARKWLILAAKRGRWAVEKPVINPYCLLLKGDQGVGKSAFFEILGGQWNYSYAQGTESTLMMQSSLTVTLDEYDRFTNKGQSELKNLISDPVDKIRQKYARSSVALNRTFSFGGTTNSSEILKDPTGSRRFLIVTLPQKYRQPYDLDWLKRNRDAIWAAALALSDDEPVEFDWDSIQTIEDNKEQYQSTTHQEELLKEWVDGNNPEAIPYRPNTAYSYSEVAAIVSPHAKLSPGEKSYLIDLLLKLGWRKGSGWRDGKKFNWMISPASVKAQPEALSIL